MQRLRFDKGVTKVYAPTFNGVSFFIRLYILEMGINFKVRLYLVILKKESTKNDKVTDVLKQLLYLMSDFRI